MKKRYQELVQKSVNGIMTVAENTEALELVPIFEKRNLEKLKLMQELAEIWDVSLVEVMKRLDFKVSSDVSSY